MENIKIINNISPDRFEEYKNIRIEALENIPQAFGSTVEEELKKEDSVWIEILQKSLENKDEFLVFAEIEGSLAGMMRAYREQSQKCAHNASIVSVYVNKKYQGKGLSSLLMESLIEKIKINTEILRLELMVVTTQISAISLYKKFGFEIVGTLHKNVSVNGVFYDEHIMERFI